MIWVTRFDGTQFAVNIDLIEYAEAKPDTVLTLVNGHRFVIREGVEEIVDAVVEFGRRIYIPLNERIREV